MLAHLKHRPGLLVALATLVGAGLTAGQYVAPLSAALMGWCAGVVAYIAVDLMIVARSNTKTMKARAAAVDEGRIAVLIITVGAAIASIAAITVNLAHAKGSPDNAVAAVLAAVTVLLSWMFVHTVFAFTYAHDFYKEGKGITFPDTPQPDYWDFAYFSFVIGATAQVSDVTVTSRSIRRMVLAHGVISFLFNTAVLAFGVNLAASLLS
jgi:uncharacterized membrane protein